LIIGDKKLDKASNDPYFPVFIVSYADEQLFKKNKWKQEFINRDVAIVQHEHNVLKMQVQLRKLKPNTIYYVKIQERNKQGDYMSQSDIVLYKTPNLSGAGDTIIKSLEQKFESKRPNKTETKENHLILWMVVPIVAVVLIVILTVGLVLALRRQPRPTEKTIDRKNNLLINTSNGHSNGQQQTWLSCTNPTNSSTYGGVVTNTNTTSDNCTSSSILSGPMSSSTTSTIKQQQQRLQLLMQQNDDYLINEQLQPLNQHASSPNDYLLQRSQCYMQPEQQVAESFMKQSCFSSTQQRKIFKNPSKFKYQWLFTKTKRKMRLIVSV
jgi:hypothetical protein